MPELYCVWMRTVCLLSGSELSLSPCFCSYTWEGEQHWKPPGRGSLCTYRDRTNWLVLNLCSALWLPGSKWFSCGAFGAVTENGAPNSQSHLQMRHLGFRGELPQIKDINWNWQQTWNGVRGLVPDTDTHEHREHMSFLVLWFYKGGGGLFRQWCRRWTVAYRVSETD